MLLWCPALGETTLLRGAGAIAADLQLVTVAGLPVAGFVVRGTWCVRFGAGQDGMLDDLLLNVHIEVVRKRVGTCGLSATVAASIAELHRDLPNISAIIGPQCSNDVKDASLWLQENQHATGTVATVCMPTKTSTSDLSVGLAKDPKTTKRSGRLRACTCTSD